MVTYSPPSLSTPSPDPASLNSSARSARRRGLSYLRNYTHIHLSPPSQEALIPASASASSSAPSHTSRQIFLRSISSPPLEQTRQTDSTGSFTASGNGQGRGVRADSESNIVSVAGLATAHPTVNTALGGLSRLISRSRSGSAPHNVSSEPEVASSTRVGYQPDQMPTIRLVPHQDPRSARPSLAFAPTSRTLPHEECVIRVGRYSERESTPNPPPNVPSAAPVGFKSKVVSRRHCEFWCSNGQWYIKDVKSSSGTFLNHIRLSQPSVESKPWPVNDGDVVQLGIDFKGGEEMIFRCVKIRIECNRAWQKSLNNFNVTTHKRLRNLGKSVPNTDADNSSTHASECSICLMSIAPCQSLFVAPCSHVWHYKCIRPILNDHKTFPQFLCPNCRAMTDLEADVDDADEEQWDEEGVGKDLNPNDFPMGGSNGIHSEHPAFSIVPAEEHSTMTTSRILSVQNGQGPFPIISNFASYLSRSTDPTVGSATSTSIINRRAASRANTQSFGGDPAASRRDTVDKGGPSFPNYPRPITPIQTHSRDFEITPDGSPSGGAEMLATDGPMTPTNHAGPFVFDGSAGRRNGQSPASDVGNLEQSTYIG